MKICPNCTKTIPNGDVFCRYCGKKLAISTEELEDTFTKPTVSITETDPEIDSNLINSVTNDLLRKQLYAIEALTVTIEELNQNLILEELKTQTDKLKNIASAANLYTMIILLS